ncbi:hypothetical protein [Sphingomicrobium sediminis]|uniref:Uncharacterized protein n=1 Tax=Sphingomicrobium sediminis TaxID=2950949 RepID=A0A9X2J1U4_9SPHN|nr:hypothetical protein [Sphingomicrobium sediminis]MCM8557618.1 hypothetical protein [Sphingomicrobium sediminis]
MTGGTGSKRSGAQRVLLGFGIVYALAGLLALIVIPASVYGWFGVESDPLSGVFALLLALPWTIALYLMGDVGTWGSLAFCTAAIALNIYLIWRFSRPRR